MKRHAGNWFSRYDEVECRALWLVLRAQWDISLIEFNPDLLYTGFSISDRKESAMRRWLILATSLLCTACQAPVTPNIELTPVIVEITMDAPMIPSSTPDCLHAEGVTLEVRRISDTKVEVRVSGLQPGESPSVTFDSAFPSGTGFRVESGLFATGADENGNFSYEEHLSALPEGEISATWDVRFIHARGVECSTITLP